MSGSQTSFQIVIIVQQKPMLSQNKKRTVFIFNLSSQNKYLWNLF